MSSSPMPLTEDCLSLLASRLKTKWPAIVQASHDSQMHLTLLRREIAGLKPPSNTSVVTFGSLAREEWTQGSDVDWTLMIDGPSDMGHFEVAKGVADKLTELKYKPPGPTAVFGSMASSHPLVHCIGGEEDTNQNTTRRILLLLESSWLSDNVTHERVVRSILERYIVGDPPSTTTSTFHVPLFLLNDVVRYWRTMAVDYATKKWQRSNDGWALRNIKLRMSRKLLYTKGLLVCFLCDAEFGDGAKSNESGVTERELLSRCYALTRRSAIDLVAELALKFDAMDSAAMIFDAYDKFLAMLGDVTKRSELETLDFGKGDNALFREQRDNSRLFQEGLEKLFFDSGNKRFTKLTRRYGVF